MEKKVEKKKASRQFKSDAQLAVAYVESVEHAVRKSCGWYDKLTKKLTSKKHSLTEAQKSYVIQTMDERHSKFVAAMEGTAKVEEFTLPKSE